MSHRRKDEERKARPWDTEREGGGGGDSFGDWLKRQRTLRDISLREISDVTKINLRYLEALEENRFAALPASVFARGFLREYARYVGLDADDVVNYYTAAQEEDEPDGAPSRPRQHRTGWPTQWVYGLVLTAIVGGLFGIVAAISWWAERRPTAESPPPIAAPVFAPAPPQPAQLVPEAPLEITLDFTENCWVEALIDGSERISELRVQGESLRLTADQSVSLTLNNAAGVRIEINGEPYEIAEGAESIKDLEITVDSLGSGVAAVEQDSGG